MDITFSKEWWDVDRDSVVFHASFENKRIRCVVTYAFLAKPYSDFPREEKALELFRTRRSEIESIIQDRIEKNAIERNPLDSVEEIVLQSADPTVV